MGGVRDADDGHDDDGIGDYDDGEVDGDIGCCGCVCDDVVIELLMWLLTEGMPEGAGSESDHRRRKYSDG